MKFKLLIAAIFITPALAVAQSCIGTAVSSCSGTNASAATCGGYYISNGIGGGTQCKFGSYCSNGGGNCGNQPAPPPTVPPAPPVPTVPPSSGAVPTIAGTITWQFSPVLTGVSASSCDDICGYYYLYYMTGTVTSYGNNSYSISGYGEAAFNQTKQETLPTQYFEVPGFGSMFLSGGQYQMMINAMFQPPPQGSAPNPVNLMMNCTLSATTLSGTCFTMSSDGSKTQTVQATWVK
jgi:hypothetical protein